MSLRFGVRGISGWVFGLSVTVLLISIWGRAVVSDTETLAESLTPLSGSATVVDRFADWVESELVDSGVEAEVANGAIDSVLATSAVGAAFEEFFGRVVNAAASVDPSGASVDVAEIFEPATSEIASSLSAAGISVPVSRVEEAIAGIDPFVVLQPGDRAVIGPASPIAARLGTAAVLSLVVMLMAGWAAVVSSDDRLSEARRLLNRVALGALSYGIMLRIGSWVLDPGGGRAPVGQTLSQVAVSKWMVPIMVAGAAGALGGLVWLFRRRVTPAEVSLPRDEAPKPEPEPQLLPIA